MAWLIFNGSLKIISRGYQQLKEERRIVMWHIRRETGRMLSMWVFA